MSIIVSEDGLRKAVAHALEGMDSEGADGFSYPIGKIRGMTARLVVEPDEGVFETIEFDGPLHFEAVNDYS